MPRILDSQASGGVIPADGNQTYTCRIGDDGAIILPIIGPFAVADRSLAEIESSIVTQYYPKYLKTPLPIYVSVAEYNTRRVSIVGAVAQPGIYALRHDQMSLVALLMESGGIVAKGAAVIRITPGESEGARSPGGPVSAAGEQGVLSGVEDVVQAVVWDDNTSGREVDPGGETLRAVFDWEGPLDTAGWLSLMKGERVVVRRYVDLASENQRLEVLKRVALEAEPEMVRDLHAGLQDLAKYLHTAPPVAGADLSRIDGTWQTTDGRRFVMSFGAPGRADRTPTEPAIPRTAETVSDERTMTLVLPVRGLNIPFTDVALKEGDSVVVEWPVEQFVSVVGLVTRPANMAYPPDARINLIQAIAFAGGLDAAADPRYISVYRLRADGSVAGVTLQLMNPKDEQQLTEIQTLPLKPGDVVSVEHTPRTRTNVFFDRVFRVSLGLYFHPDSLWNNE